MKTIVGYPPTDPAGGPARYVVCIDGRMLNGAGTGVASYAGTLVEAVRRAGFDPAILADGGIGARKPAATRWLGGLRPGIRHARTTDEGWLVRDVFREAHLHFRAYGRLLTVACDAPPAIMHWTYPVPIRMSGAHNLYTVHDAIPLTRPDLTPIDPRRYRRVMERICETAAGIVTVSEAARNEIIAATGCDDRLVRSLGQAVPVMDLPAGRPAVLPAALLPDGFFLFCGSVEPRKNIAALVAAHAASGSRRPLVIVGPDGWNATSVADALRLPGVIRIPYLPRTVLIDLMHAARALLFPTLAEGFGLPVAEAMTLGTPVLTADRGALAEVAGGAALLVDPTDVAAMAEAIRRLDHDDGLCRSLSARGRDRAGAFEIRDYAERLRSLYASLLS